MSISIYKQVLDHRLALILISVILFFGVLLYYNKIISVLPYHPDEYQYTARSYFLELFIKKDFENPLWQSHYSYDQPKLSYYVFGIVLSKFDLINNNLTNHLHEHELYQNLSRKTPYYFDLLKLLAPFQNRNLSTITNFCTIPLCKSIPIILEIRVINVILLSLVVVLVFHITLRITKNIISSLAACELFAYNELIMKSSLSATSEALFLLLFFFGVYLLITVNKLNDRKFLILLSIVIALCTSTKLHGAILLPMYFGMLVLNAYVKNTKKIVFSVIAPALIVAFISFVIMVLIDPFLWKNPIGNILNYYEYRHTIVDVQQQLFSESALVDIPARIYALTNHFFLAHNGNDDYSKLYNFQSMPSFIRSPFFVIGAIWLMRNWKNTQYLRAWATVVVVILSVHIFFQTLDWSRYYDIFVLVYVVMIASGLKELIKVIKLGKISHFLLKDSIST